MRKISFCDMTMEGNMVWAVLSGSNYIVRFDMNDDRVEVIGKTDEEIRTFNYLTIEKYKEKLFLVPLSGEKIVCFDLQTKKTEKIELLPPSEDRKEVYMENYKFYGAYRYGNKLYLPGIFYPAIVCIDMESLRVSYIDDWVKDIEGKIQKGDDNGYIGGGWVEEGDSVYFPFTGYHALLKLDLDTEKTEFVELPMEFSGFSYLMSKGSEFWLEGRDNNYGEICIYDRNTRKSKFLDLTAGEVKIIDHFLPRWKLFQYSDGVLALPQTSKHAYYINTKTLESKRIEMLSNLELRSTEIGEVAYTTMVKRLGENVYISSTNGNFWIFDIGTGAIKERSYYISEELWLEEKKKWIMFSRDNQRILKEDNFSLEDYIMSLS